MAMEFRYLGRTGLKVSNICLGTMTFGHSEARPNQADEATAHMVRIAAAMIAY